MAATLALARARNPERFSTDQMPQILVVSDAAWINKPADNTEVKLAA
ncbi:hypothetical protein RCH23_003165 [Cryobacterium sp. CAN_C3]|nr:hypothetical protein [Cryobacterium sp. CAN_C3]MEC5155764.1 hypothetical protein [Cryobacterium sp. CAN_C3]